eukprot:5240888-Prymnesium_polylepis.1
MIVAVGGTISGKPKLWTTGGIKSLPRMAFSQAVVVLIHAFLFACVTNLRTNCVKPNRAAATAACDKIKKYLRKAKTAAADTITYADPNPLVALLTSTTAIVYSGYS